MISKLSQFLAREMLLHTQRRELAKLRTEVEQLRLQNEKINRAMRRCLTCDYRLDALSADRTGSGSSASVGNTVDGFYPQMTRMAADSADGRNLSRKPKVQGRKSVAS